MWFCLHIIHIQNTWHGCFLMWRCPYVELLSKCWHHLSTRMVGCGKGTDRNRKSVTFELAMSICPQHAHGRCRQSVKHMYTDRLLWWKFAADMTRRVHSCSLNYTRLSTPYMYMYLYLYNIHVHVYSLYKRHAHVHAVLSMEHLFIREAICVHNMYSISPPQAL